MKSTIFTITSIMKMTIVGITTMLGVPKKRILLYWGLYWGSPHFGETTALGGYGKASCWPSMASTSLDALQAEPSRAILGCISPAFRV